MVECMLQCGYGADDEDPTCDINLMYLGNMLTMEGRNLVKTHMSARQYVEDCIKVQDGIRGDIFVARALADKALREYQNARPNLVPDLGKKVCFLRRKIRWLEGRVT